MVVVPAHGAVHGDRVAHRGDLDTRPTVHLQHVDVEVRRRADAYFDGPVVAAAHARHLRAHAHRLADGEAAVDHVDESDHDRALRRPGQTQPADAVEPGAAVVRRAAEAGLEARVVDAVRARWRTPVARTRGEARRALGDRTGVVDLLAARAVAVAALLQRDAHVPLGARGGVVAVAVPRARRRCAVARGNVAGERCGAARGGAAGHARVRLTDLRGGAAVVVVPAADGGDAAGLAARVVGVAAPAVRAIAGQTLRARPREDAARRAARRGRIADDVGCVATRVARAGRPEDVAGAGARRGTAGDPGEAPRSDAPIDAALIDAAYRGRCSAVPARAALDGADDDGQPTPRRDAQQRDAQREGAHARRASFACAAHAPSGCASARSSSAAARRQLPST